MDKKEIIKPTKKALSEEVDDSGVAYWKLTQELILELETLFEMKIIVLYLSNSLSELEVDELYAHIQNIGNQQRLGLIINGPGGSVIAAYRIIKLLRSYTNELIIIAPNIAASALTLMTLGADIIYTSPLTAFSPIDTSIANHPLAPTDKDDNPVTVEITEVQKFLELVNNKQYSENTDFSTTPHSLLAAQVNPLFLGSVQRALTLSKLLVEKIARTHIQDDKLISKIVKKMNDDYPSHSFPLMKDDLVDLGLNLVDLSANQSVLSHLLFNYLKSICEGGEEIKGKEKSIWRTRCVVESIGLRSYEQYSFEEKYINNKWEEVSNSYSYERAVAVNSDGKQIITPLTVPQYNKWSRGEEISI